MAPASKLQSLPVIPAIPRIFETKRKGTVKESSPVSETKQDVQNQKSPERASESAQAVESTDWASLTALNSEDKGHIDSQQQDDDTENRAAAVTAESPESKEHATKANGSYPPTETIRPEMNGHQQSASAPQPNGYYPNIPRSNWSQGPPPGFGNESHHHRNGANINFGSFGNGNFGSQDSSPSLPPSATSTHFTQPTPMSDTNSHTSRAGHNNEVRPQMGPPPGLHHPPTHSRNQSGFLDPRPQDFGELLVHATASFDDRNKLDLLKSVEQDLFAAGPEALDLTVGTPDGKDSFRIWRAVARRSPALVRFLDRVASPSTPTELQSYSAFVSLDSVRAVVRSLYGAPLIAAEFLDGRQALHFKRPLEIIATGHLLGAGHVIDFGAELALKMMRWESLAANFQFCIEEKRQDYGSGKGPDLVDLPHIAPFGRPHHVEILAQSLDCLIREINGDEGFRFDDQAAYFSELGGGFQAVPASVQLPGYKANANPTNGPSQIQFGSMGNFYRHKHQTISSILLSLPLVILQHVLSHVFSLNIVQDVVSERERRRRHALKISRGGVLPHHAHYQESIMPTPEFNGLRIVSVRVRT